MRVDPRTALAAALLLAGCGEKPGDPAEPQTKQEVAAQIAQSANPRPGQYRSTIEFTRFDIPGLPADALSQVRQQMESATAVQNSYCLTAEEAARGRQDVLKRLGKAQGDCRFTRYEVDGEKVSATLSCAQGPGGGTVAMTMDGTMGTTGSDIRIAMDMANPAVPAAKANIAMHVVTTRIGDCS